MNTKKLFLILTMFTLVAIVSLPPLYGGDEARIGTAGGVQVQVPVGARSLAMGGSNIADVQGLEALYWNPAGLGILTNNASGVFSTMKIFNTINVNHLGLGFKMGKLGALGFSLKAIDLGDIPVTTNQDMDGLSGQTFAPTFVTAGLTYANRLTDAISVGVTGKLIVEEIPRASASAIAFDLGIQYKQLGGIGGLSLGVALKNIGSEMQYTGSAFLVQAQDAGSDINDFREIPTAQHKLPTSLELGLGYRYTFSENNSLLLTGNFQNQNFGNDLTIFGGEYAYSDLIFLRGGYLFNINTNSEDELYTFTLGLGLHYKVGATDLMFDYSFRDSQYFDGNNMFQLTIGF
jgi:hypothetical protein